MMGTTSTNALLYPLILIFEYFIKKTVRDGVKFYFLLFSFF
jgi:hypothetical protein